MTVDPGSRGWNEHRHLWTPPAADTITNAMLASGIDGAKLNAASVAASRLAVQSRLIGSYVNVPTWSITTTGVWTRTPVIVTATPQGGSLSLVGAIHLAHSAAGGAAALVAFGADNVVSAANGYAFISAAGQAVSVPFIYPLVTGSYAGASHTFEIWAFNATAGTLSIYTGAYSILGLYEGNG